MPFAERTSLVWALAMLLLSAPVRTAPFADVHGQRYAMGTMFDVVVYHHERGEAERAIDAALDEVVRLDRVMSHYDASSELARLHRTGRMDAVSVDPSLYDVIGRSLEISRRSGGRFDVTIGPLLRIWKIADSEGRRASAAEVAAARQCVGYEHVELRAPDKVRLNSSCLAIDLGGIGKGYAVDRAIDVLKHAGITNAIVNAGGSSIAAIGTPAGRQGWPVLLAGGRRVLMLSNTSISTSQQDPERPFGDIIDPLAGAPAANRLPVVVAAPEAALSDALSTTMAMLTVEEGTRLLAEYPGVSGLWLSSAGEVHASYRASRLSLAPAN